MRALAVISCWLGHRPAVGIDAGGGLSFRPNGLHYDTTAKWVNPGGHLALCTRTRK